MFSGASSFNQDISSWDVSNVTNMTQMFSGATSFNQDISSWDVSNVISMQSMFQGATSFNQDIGGWDVTSLTNATNMFGTTGGGSAVTLSTANYDALLIGWAAQSVNTGVVFSGGDSKYSAGAAATARGVLTSAPNNWTITDGGFVIYVYTDVNGVTVVAIAAAVVGQSYPLDGTGASYLVVNNSSLTSRVNAGQDVTNVVTTNVTSMAQTFFLKNMIIIIYKKMETQHKTLSSDLEKEYLESLNEKELQAYNIAKNHLGESYSLAKSNGFLEFVASRKSE